MTIPSSQIPCRLAGVETGPPKRSNNRHFGWIIRSLLCSSAFDLRQCNIWTLIFYVLAIRNHQFLEGKFVYVCQLLRKKWLVWPVFSKKKKKKKWNQERGRCKHVLWNKNYFTRRRSFRPIRYVTTHTESVHVTRSFVFSGDLPRRKSGINIVDPRS